ncbi:MAG: UDP-N-acetylmuramate dehydrogenase [Chitinophagaceae bacterium]
MQIRENISLKQYNTFGIDAKAKSFSSFGNPDELSDLIQQSEKEQKLILGGGSNILLSKDFDGIVLKNEITGKEKVKEDDDSIYIKVGAGENWHQFVVYCIKNNWAGIENLSLIPGNVGASPMQNIGAYGVEIKEVFHELKAYHIHEKAIHTFNVRDCEFGYRESVFKRRYKNEYVILDVTYRLNKRPVFHTGYGAVEQELEKMKIDKLSIAAISQAVINIRSSKLPDPVQIGNAGSFFKNPSIPKQQFEQLRIQFPGIVAYENPDKTMKLAAGWLIEHCGPSEGESWKGFRQGDAGVHSKQSLVLVNYGHATGEEIYSLSTRIVDSVQLKFGIILEREVNII